MSYIEYKRKQHFCEHGRQARGNLQSKGKTKRLRDPALGSGAQWERFRDTTGYGHMPII
jgi:hypothetical protein